MHTTDIFKYFEDVIEGNQLENTLFENTSKNVLEVNHGEPLALGKKVLNRVIVESWNCSRATNISVHLV